MDASVGLAFSLQLFHRYQRSGVLQADIPRMPGVQGPCKAYIHLTSGSVTACYLEDRRGKQFPCPLEKLRQVDHERGPFAWIFETQVHQPSPSQAPASPASPVEQQPASTPSLPVEVQMRVPKAVAALRWEQFSHWSPEQKLMLQNVWKNIDGKRTIYEVKASLPYPPSAIDDILQTLLTLRIIALSL